MSVESTVSTDPLGPVEEVYETDPQVFGRVFLALLAVGTALIGLGFLISSYSIELWMFGGFAVVMALVTKSASRGAVAGRLTLHERGLRFARSGSATAIRWDEIDRARIARIPIKMEGLVTVDHNYEVTVFARDGRTIRLGREFLDQVPGMRVKELVRRFEPYERAD